MNIKTLLLGTGAALAVASGAQAADLAVAVEPVDYVKVCDAFGTGYYYIPGTDTCLKIGGYVQMDIWFWDSSKVGNVVGQDVTVTPPLPGTYPVHTAKDGYSSSWEMKTETGVSFTAKTMSDMGPIVTFLEMRAKSNNDDYWANSQIAYLDTAYGQIGPLMFGWAASTFDYEGGFTYDGSIRSDIHTDQVRFTYAMGGWGLMLGLEDPRDRWEGTASGDMPDIILAVTGGAGGWDWKASLGVTDRTGGTGWGANFGATVDLGGGAKLRGNIAYSDDAPNFVGGPGSAYGSWWSAFVTGTVALSGNVSAAATVAYLEGPSSYDKWSGALGIYWAVTGNSHIGAEVLYEDPSTGDSSTGAHIRLKTSF